MEKNQQNQEPVLRKGKPKWQISGQAHQEEKKEDPNKIRTEREDTIEIHTDTIEIHTDTIEIQQQQKKS